MNWDGNIVDEKPIIDPRECDLWEDEIIFYNYDY